MAGSAVFLAMRCAASKGMTFGGAGLIFFHMLVMPLLAFSTPAQAQGQSSIKGDKELGKYLSRECITCHQITGRATTSIPMIVAWPEDQFVAVMNSYKDKHRDNEVMQTIAGKLSDEDIAALAAYFGGQMLQPKIK